MWEWINTVNAEKRILCSSQYKPLASVKVYMYRMQTWEKDWKGAIQGWRSLKFSYFYCVCCFATSLYGGLGGTPSIIDKCWKDGTMLFWKSKHSSTSHEFSLCTAIFAFPSFIIMIIICSSLFPCLQSLIFKGSLLWHSVTQIHTDPLFLCCIWCSQKTNDVHPRSPKIILIYVSVLIYLHVKLRL